MRYLFNIVKGLLIATLFISSCKKEVTELPASLKGIIENSKNCICNPYINQYLWKGKVTYIASCGGPACSCTWTYYNAGGVVIKMPMGYTFNNFSKESTFVETVWSCN